jgi:hypothetical protein
MSNIEISNKQNIAPQIIKVGLDYFITTSLGSKVKVEERIAKIIQVAIRIQSRIDSGPNKDETTQLSQIAEGVNCHKMALFLRDEIPLNHLIDQNRLNAGHKEVYELVSKTESDESFYWSMEDLEAGLAKSSTTQSVHLLRMISDRVPYLPSHSFVWLGRDEKTGEGICFHKTGPGSRMKFEIASSEKILKPYKENSPSITHPLQSVSGEHTDYVAAVVAIN